MESLDTVLSAHDDVLQVLPGWGQGKATFGGLCVGALVRSLRRQVPDRPLRSVSAELVAAPAPGPATVHCQSLRESKSVSTWRGELRQADRLMTHLVAVFGAGRGIDGPAVRCEAPPAPPAAAVEPMDMSHGFAPEFTRHFVYRTVRGMPLAGEHETVGWIAARAPVQNGDEGWLMALVDAWWLTAFTAVDSMRPMATLTFSCELHLDPKTLDTSAPLLHHGQYEGMVDGFARETRRLFTADGRLVTTNRQLVVVMK